MCGGSLVVEIHRHFVGIRQEGCMADYFEIDFLGVENSEERGCNHAALFGKWHRRHTRG